MIIRRHLYPENKLTMKNIYDNGMELKPIYKKVPQSNSTSPGNSIVRDVDNLLKPIQRPKHIEEINDQQSQSSKDRTERNLWRNEEVMDMLYTMQQVKALEKLNDKTVKSENVFKDVEAIMRRNGFVKKSHVQIWTKWKFLKSTYMTSRRNGIIPRIVPPQIYEMIHQMITGLNQSLADSCSSVDGDNSSTSGMVISGVEGGISDTGDINGKHEDSFGMAHPIFGFRLGIVKPEPADTGYEPADNDVSDKDPLEEELSHTKSDNEFNTEEKVSTELQPAKKVLEIPHRGRGRPPKNPPAATSTPNKTPSPATMPPLRVAPFAKANNSDNDNAADRPPPPLTMPPRPRIRVTNFSNLKEENQSKFAQPKLIPKPTHQEQSMPLQPIRIPKEVTGQSRTSSTPSPSYPKMKQIPMRKTPYSLRPDRAIPDLEASLSPPPPPIEKPSNKKMEEVSTMKHYINRNNLQNAANRKRRNDCPEPVADKMPKYNNYKEEESNNSNSYNKEYDTNYGKILQNVIIDLSSSLRKMQTDMMRDFFNKQNELLEREHKFQMQQDNMIMKAFQQQTQEIMHSVKQLVGGMKTHKNCQRKEKQKLRKEEKIRMQQMLSNHCREDEENQIEDEELNQMMEEHNEIERDTEDMYTDDEQQQDPIQERNVNDQEEEESDGNETQDENHSKLTEPQNENALHAYDTSNTSNDN